MTISVQYIQKVDIGRYDIIFVFNYKPPSKIRRYATNALTFPQCIALLKKSLRNKTNTRFAFWRILNYNSPIHFRRL